MKKLNLVLAATLMLMLGCVQPVYADESPVVSNITEVSAEEKTAAFIEKYSGKMDELIELTKGDDYNQVTNKMRGFAYNEMLTNLPYDGFCYPTENGEGLKLFKDYMYCGTLVNGLAEGQGKMYRVANLKLMDHGMFVGSWHNDAPNGYGEEHSNGRSFSTVIKGNYVDWYQNGDMVSTIIYGSGSRTYRYHITDKFGDVIDTKVTSQHGNISVVAYAEDYPKSFLTLYDSGQTVLDHPIDDGIKKNSHGYYYTGL